MKLKTRTQVAILTTVIAFLHLGNAYGLGISVTSWTGTEQVEQPNLRLATSVIMRALNTYGNILEGPRPIRLRIGFQDLGETTAALSGAEFTRTAPGLPGIWFPDPLASQLTNTDIPLAPAYQASMTINSRFINRGDFDYSLTPNVPAGKHDFLHAMLHELGHCMGFQNICNGDGSWFGVPPNNPSDLHSWFLWYEDFPGDYVQFVSLNQAERSVALSSDALYWWGDYVGAASGGPFQLWAPWSSPMFPENHASHWDPSHSPDELMEPFATPNLRELGALSPALRDLGWTLRPVFVLPRDIEIMATLAKSGSSQPVHVMNNRNVSTSIYLTISGPHASEFMATGVPGTINMAPYQTYTITVSGAPSSLGYKTATLRAEYDDGTVRVIEVTLSMFAIGVDTDGDGIDDDDETRDLDPITPSIQNPFNSVVADSTGEEGLESPDGAVDGDNDFDGDGMTNIEEFVFGYSPIDPQSFGVRSPNDSDGDGISDADEIRDLDAGTPGTQNPFNPYHGDVTGNYPNEDIPDGIPDGRTDYDGDGLSNSLEFAFGLNPLVPDTGVTIPASCPFAMVTAVLAMLWLGCSHVRREARY